MSRNTQPVTELCRSWCRALRARLNTAFLTGMFLTCLSVASGSEIVMFGDSWGVLMGPAMRSVLDAEGLTSAAIHNASVGGSSAVEWNRGTHGSIPAILTANPDVLLVHVIVGGIDLLGDTGNPAAAVERTIPEVLGVLQSITAVTTAPILYTGYDYLANPPSPLTVAVANQFLDALVNGVSEAVSRDPLLASRVTVINTHGFMQIQYGIPQLGIVPHDPSLPDPALPGPVNAFSDQIHLTQTAYQLLAQELYRRYHSLALKPCCLVVECAGEFLISSVKGLSFEVEYSQDLITWASIGVVTNVTGTLRFQDPHSDQRAGGCFYRAVSLR